MVRRILWLCPFQLPTIPPLGLPDDVEFTESRRLDEVAGLLEDLKSPRFDVVVVDTSPAPGHDYDPVDIMALIAGKCISTPRYLIAVIKQGLDMDPADSQIAFAVEMQGLWRQKRPGLIIEEAVLYYLEEIPGDVGKPKRQKDHSVGQTRLWAAIADQAIRLAGNEPTSHKLHIPPLTRAFVEAMCAESKPDAGPYFNASQRTMLFELARRRLSVKALAEDLRYRQDFVRRLQREISAQLTLTSEPVGHELGRPDHSAFCDALIDRYGPWLLSRSKRAARRPSGRPKGRTAR